MPLVLSAPSRPLLSAELLRPGPQGIFVPTHEVHGPGELLQLVVQIKDERLGTALECKVLDQTLRGPSGGPGLYVALSADQQQKAKEFLGLVPNADQPARTEVRVDCQLPMRLLSPQVDTVFHTRNLSRSGVLASCSAALEANSQVKIALELNANETLTARCKVAWVRHELSLVGLKFEHLTDHELSRIDGLVTALQASTEQTPELPSGHADSGRPDVIVADDEPSVALFVQKIATKMGLKVLTFERGDTALKAIRSLRPRLVMTDVLMPGLDGLQVCSLIRADAMLAKTPVVLLSALEGEKVKKIAEEAGATAWLQKPLDLQAVRKLITEALKATEGK